MLTDFELSAARSTGTGTCGRLTRPLPIVAILAGVWMFAAINPLPKGRAMKRYVLSMVAVAMLLVVSMAGCSDTQAERSHEYRYLE